VHFALEGILGDLHGLAQHLAHVFHHHPRLDPGEGVRVEDLPQRTHPAVGADADHVVLVPGGLAVVLEDALAAGAVPHVFRLAEARDDVGFGRDALLQLRNALRVATRQHQQHRHDPPRTAHDTPHDHLGRMPR
jgi:hypothetical protein